MAWDEKSDDQLVLAARGGDEQAFEVLLRRHFGLVHAIGYSRFLDADAAEDFAQEVWLRLWLNLHKLEQPQAFAAWLSALARNVAADWLRREQRRSHLVPMVPLEEQIHEPPDDSAERMLRHMDQERKLSIIEEALSRLSEEQRELVLMHYSCGMNYREIADRLGTHPTTVSRNLSRALDALKKKSERLLEEGLRRLAARSSSVAKAVGLIVGVGAMSVAQRSALAAEAGLAGPMIPAPTIGTASVVKPMLLKGGFFLTASAAIILGAFFFLGFFEDPEPAVSAENPLVVVRVVDEQGNPVEGAQAEVQHVQFNKDRPDNVYSSGTGRELLPSDDEGELRVIGTEGWTPSTMTIPGATEAEKVLGYRLEIFGGGFVGKQVLAAYAEFPKEVVLEEAVPVVVKRIGGGPEGRVRVVPERESIGALVSRPVITPVEEISGNRWRVWLKEGESYVIGWNTPHRLFGRKPEMQGYISEPFIAEKEAEVEFSTGQPVRVSYELKDVPPGVMAFPASIFLVKTAKRNGEKTTLSMGFNQRMEAEGVYTFEGVAPGEYELYAYFERSGTSDYIKPWLEDRRAVVVEGGKENVFEARYPTIDKTVEEGDFTIRGRAARSTGTPIANAEVALIPYKEDPETKVIEWLFGGRIHENVRTDDNGNYEFRGVSPDYADFYEVRLIGVDGAGTGASNIRPADWKAGEVVRDFSVRSNFIPQTGHALPDLQIEMLDGSKRKLSDYRGAPVVIHVWARWRPEGPASMPPFVELARANKDGGTQFLALDRNDNWDKWRELVREKKWDDIDNAIMDWDANDSFLNVDVPYSIVLDGEGVVLDHGQGINVERWLPAQTSN